MEFIEARNEAYAEVMALRGHSRRDHAIVMLINIAQNAGINFDERCARAQGVEDALDEDDV